MKAKHGGACLSSLIRTRRADAVPTIVHRPIVKQERQSHETSSTTKVLEGVLAYEELFAADSEPLTKLLQNAEVSHSGTETSVNWEGESELLVESFQELKQRTEQWMKRFMEKRHRTADSSTSESTGTSIRTGSNMT